LSPVTPRTQSEDERESTSTAAEGLQLMADLDASIADALNSIEALMQPRRTRPTEDGYDNAAMTGTAAAGYRSVSAGDVRWSAAGMDAQTSASTGMITQLPQDPPSPQLSSVSCSSLHDDGEHAASSTPEVFQPDPPQPAGIDGRGGDDRSTSRSSTVTELRSETTTNSTTTAFPKSAKSSPPSSSGVPALAVKSHGPQLPVKPRSVGVRRDRSSRDSALEGTTTETFTSNVAADTDTALRLPAAKLTGKVLRRRDPELDEQQTTSTASRSTVSVQTTSATTSVSVSTTISGSTDVSSSGRRLPELPRPTEPETLPTRTSKESSFSSVRALLNRKSGGSPRTGTARADRPVRRSRHQIGENVQTKFTSGSAPSSPVSSLPDEPALASDRSAGTTERQLQAGKNGFTGTTTMSMTQAESQESITTSSCSSLPEITDVEATQPRSSVFPPPVPRDQIDRDSLEVSFEELTRAMAILSPVVEGSRDGVAATVDQQSGSADPSAINADVLMTIRKYIASSLQQMRMLEQQVKLIPVLQLRVSVLKEDKRLLKLQLQKSQNGSGATTFKTDACVGVTVSELSVTGTEKDIPVHLERSNLPEQLQSPVERRDVGVGDCSVDTKTNSRLYCPSCKSDLRQHFWQSPSTSETVREPSKVMEEEITGRQKSVTESENVGYPSVSLLISKLQGQDKNDTPPTRRLWSVEKAVHDSVRSPEVHVTSPDTSCNLTRESSAFAALRRPKPPVPRKQISIHLEDGTNRTSVGIQCTLLKDNRESHGDGEPEILPPELDTTNKRLIIERAEFRAREPDLVTTHCLGGLSQNEYQIQPVAVYPLKTFADKETETDRTSQRSAAVNTVSSTVEETLSQFSSDDSRSPAQMIHCSINTDISGDIWSATEHQMPKLTGEERSMISSNLYTTLDIRLEPRAYEEQTTAHHFMDTGRKSGDIAKDSTREQEVVQSSAVTFSQDIVRRSSVVHSVKDASCSADIVTKPVTNDASSCTDESLLYSVIRDASKLQYAAEVKPSVRDVECSADITIRPSLATIASNTETSWDQLSSGSKVSVREIGCSAGDLPVQPVANDVASATEKKDIRPSDAKDAFCQTDPGKKPSTREVACGRSHTGPPSNLVDAACGNDEVVEVAVTPSVPNVTDVGCNTDVKATRNAECDTIEEKQPAKHASCLADIKLSVCDKSSATVPDTEFVGETVKAGEQSTPQQTVTSKDMACLTDSLTTCEMSSNTEEHVTGSSKMENAEVVSGLSLTGARLPGVEVGCVTDITWKPATNEIGCNTEDTISSVETASSSNLVAEDALALKPPQSTSIALNTDAWLLASDLTFLDAVKEILRSSTTETASMTDTVEILRTCDASTSPVSVDVLTSECSTNTDVDVKPALVDVESSAQPTVCEVACNTDADGQKRQVRDAASGVDIVLHPSVTDVSVNTDTEVRPPPVDVETLARPTVCEVGCNTEAEDKKRQVRDVASDVDIVLRPSTTDVSSSTDEEAKPLLVDAESSARPTVCEIACNTDAEVQKRQIKDAASGSDVVLLPSATDASVNTDEEAGSSASKPLRSVASNTDTTVHPDAIETSSSVTSSSYLQTGLSPGATHVLPDLKDASSATDAEVKPSLVDVESLARPAVCEVGCNTDAVCHVSVGTEATPKLLSADAVSKTEQTATVVRESWSETRHVTDSYGADAVERLDKEVTAKADTAEVACVVALRPTLRSIACGIDAEVVNDRESYLDSVADARVALYETDAQSEIRQSDLPDTEAPPVFRETNDVACNTENMLTPWMSDDTSRLSCDNDALKDFSAISTIYWTNDERTKVCRLCGVKTAPKPYTGDDASITDISPQLISPHDTDIPAERKQTEGLLSSKAAGLVAGHLRANGHSGDEELDLREDTVDDSTGEWRQVGVGVRPATKDVGCDAGRILTTDTAINTYFSIDLIASKQEMRETDVVSEFRQVDSALGSGSRLAVASTQDTASMTEPLQSLESVPVRTTKDVACGTSDVILPTYEEACSTDDASTEIDAAVQAKLVAATSLLDRTSAVSESVLRATKCPTCLAKPTTRDSSCGTDSPPLLLDDLRHGAADHDVESATIPSGTVHEVCSNSDRSRTVPKAVCSTESATPKEAVTDAARKPSRIPHRSGTAATRRPDALVAKPVTKDASCITDIAIAPSDEDDVLRKTDREERPCQVVTAEVACNTEDVVERSNDKQARTAVRTVGCSADLSSAEKKPSTRDAGCTARPQTKSQSCVTDSVVSEPATDTPVKVVEKTRTGLQVGMQNHVFLRFVFFCHFKTLFVF